LVSTDGLERNLGLFPTMMISMGAMIGSGIFVLPAIGFKKAGAAVILAYVISAIIVLPAALSKSEMATAMPESGGTYIYIDRALGPLFGTIAGIGSWFSLTFKSAFALVGLGSYMLLIAPVSSSIITPLALILGIVVVVLNILGTELSGKVQSIIVSIVLLGLLAFSINSGIEGDYSRLDPFATHGSWGVLTAAAFVFVSFAGVTKIASIAEEVENPSKNLPRAMIGSMSIMTVVYVFVVTAIVIMTDPKTLKSSGPNGASLTPMADGAEVLFGGFGVTIVSILAIVALTSMANAGVLSTSRFPLAMSRDSLLPPQLSEVNPRYGTPQNSILITGAVLLLLIAFVPVIELAKLASAFKILVFSISNIALIAFRESDMEEYDPDFKAPGYPYVQIFGIVGGLVLITQMGWLSIIGAVGIITAGVVVYFVYGRKRTNREGAVSSIRTGEDQSE
jgi:APA family basic amino acid/polyamine antiporter